MSFDDIMPRERSQSQKDHITRDSISMTRPEQAYRKDRKHTGGRLGLGSLGGMGSDC